MKYSSSDLFENNFTNFMFNATRRLIPRVLLHNRETRVLHTVWFAIPSEFWMLLRSRPRTPFESSNSCWLVVAQREILTR